MSQALYGLTLAHKTRSGSMSALCGGLNRYTLSFPSKIKCCVDRVSHETIYRSLFVQARGVLEKELLYHLRSKRTIRRSKQACLISDGRGQIKDIVSIRQRPAAVEAGGAWPLGRRS